MIVLDLRLQSIIYGDIYVVICTLNYVWQAQ